MKRMDSYLRYILQSRNFNTHIYFNSQNNHQNVNWSWSCQCYIQTYRPQRSSNPWM